ncbi:MAG: hypothetical protein ACP5JU_04215, partial [Minisyncoccia bacterium]
MNGNRKVPNPLMFGAKSLDSLKDVPAFRFFHNGLLVSHRYFDTFYAKLLSGESSAIVSGMNPSGRFHLGHIGVFDTNLFFQKKYGIEVFAP